MKANYRIEVFYKIPDSRGQVLLRKLNKLGYKLRGMALTDNYLINADINVQQADKIAASLSQHVTQSYSINKPYVPENFDYALEIGFLPGVTDNVAHTTREIIEDLFHIELDPEKSVFTTTTYFITGNIGYDVARSIGMELHNPLIQRIAILTREQYLKTGMGYDLPVVHITAAVEADEVSLDLSDQELARLGKEGIADKDGSRRGPLALDMASICTIKSYFKDIEKRNPTDIELESIAQTWSEHCKHTIFAAKLDDIDDGIFKRYIREATIKIRKAKGDKDFCRSVFTDNAGGIEFDENYIVADKVETHNSPSALDPFGGSITGIVGVNRDAMGFGMGSKPIANRYGFCFANPFDEKPLYRGKDMSTALLTPRRIMEGVIHGVNVGGNQSGIPTPQGFVYFDDRYKGKPLVFVGTIGLIPKHVANQSSVEKQAQAGDCIVMTGGRVGRDGIHGATFSSEALNSGSPATAVQIGDPITQKKMSDAIVKEARDKGLYHSITDNGAGGLSCSVAEMAKECGGFIVDLEKVPLKYHGLAPWQIWISESQERMTLSVPKDNCDEFLELMRKRDVEATVIGEFTDSGRGIVKYNGKVLFDLDLKFLHDGLPQRTLKSAYSKPNNPYPEFDEPSDMTKTLLDMCGRLNTASFEFISTQYDHEVQSNSVIKPLQGKGRVNGSASVIRPILDSVKGVVMSQGIYPSYSEIDTYQMAACSIDTAIRNAIACGGSLDRMALLDNFCWCDSNNPERLGQLKEAARACYDFAVAYGTPFISGKDSMFNDFRGYDDKLNEVFISVPPTLLVSSIGIIEDIYKTQTIDFKFAGDVIYLIGLTHDEIGGSEYLAYKGEKLIGKRYLGDAVPHVDAVLNAKVYRAYERAMRRDLIASGISIERGGLGVALAKSAMAGMLGCKIDLSHVLPHKSLRSDMLLFCESQGRLLVSVDMAKAGNFEKAFNGLPFARIGEVSSGTSFEINNGTKKCVKTDVNNLMTSYKGLFREF